MSVVDGLISGLNTTQIINAIMSTERLPVARLQNKSDDADKKLQAWTDITRTLGTLRTNAQALARSSTFSQSVATSSDATVATVTAQPNTRAATVSFKVQQLATAHSVMTHSSIGAGSKLTGTGAVAAGLGLQSLGFTGITLEPASVAAAHDVKVSSAGGNQVTVTIGNQSVTVDRNAGTVQVGGITLSIGSAGLSDGSGKLQVVTTDEATTNASLASSFSTVRANVLTLNSGSVPDSRLVFTSPATGEANQVMIGSVGLSSETSAALGSLDVVSAGRDATVEIGDGVVVHRATNTLNDVFGGLSVQLVKADPAKTVDVAAGIDTSGLTTQVSNWVNALNAALSLIDSKTAYDPAAKTGGVLVGDPTARSIRQQMTSALAATTGTGTYKNLSSIGISVDRSGHYTIDQTKLADAISADPGSVGSLFSRAGSATSAGVGFGSATDATRPGTYAVNITQVAARAASTGNTVTTLGGDETLTFSLGSKSLNIALTEGQTTAELVSAMNSAFRANGFSATADLDGGALRVRSDSFGSKTILKIASDRVGADATGLAGDTADVTSEFAGEDVAGTIDGVEALGSGLNLTATTGKATGLRLQITSSTTGDLGTVTYDGGVGGSLLRALSTTGGADAMVTAVTAGLNADKKDFAQRILDYQDRLTATETRIRAQFTAMESMLQSLRGQQSRLAAAIPNNSNNNTSA